MDFFAAQEHARLKSRWLVFWFVLAVLGIIAVIYLVVTIWLGYGNKHPVAAFHLWDTQRFVLISFLAGGGIASASLYKIWQISRQGGAFVAEQLGGCLISRDTQDPAEKRLLNVIDEMSIAAGIPAPVAYVLPEEGSLNAFAAGLSTHDSVIGVTHGLLETMNRDELQGVIGHEMSHIVNGDSRLNIELIGVLFGIYALTVVGRVLMRARGRNNGAVVIGGLVLCLVGAIGLFFGRLIQAAVSREREFLADASSVQFTRNPDGLVSALDKLRGTGSRIEHPGADAASHLFFGEGTSSWFATHPPLDERIRRISGKVLDPAPEASGEAASSITSLFGAPAMAALAGATAKSFSAGMTPARALLAALPESLRQQAQNIAGATGIIGGLLFSDQPDILSRQEKQLPPAALSVAQELHQWLFSQPEEGARYRIVWLDIALPALREAPEAERQQLLVLAEELIHADGRVTPSEFALYSILRSTLLPLSVRRIKRGELSTEQLDRDIANLLALLAHAGQEDPETALAAYQAAINASPAGTKAPFPEKTALSLSSISQAFTRLVSATPTYRKKLLDACVVAIEYDGKITPVENELLRAFAQSLGCPAPLL
ncbi:MAG: M48 family metallopeptidase [Betaproteobacteria bacterium]|nr:M48 family metallopeptidase [Betaproteobacteria bacterium]